MRFGPAAFLAAGLNYFRGSGSERLRFEMEPAKASTLYLTIKIVYNHDLVGFRKHYGDVKVSTGVLKRDKRAVVA